MLDSEARPTRRSATPKARSTVKVGVDEYAQLRDMILREQVMPNEHLVEQEYAARLGTSRSNIRKALARLEQDGLVVLEPFRGARVRRITASEAVEIFEVRSALEVMLMQQVGEHVTELDKRELKALVVKVQVAARALDTAAVGLASRRLREELWRISGNNTAARLLGGLNTQLVRTCFRIRAVSDRADAIASQLSEVADAVCEASPGKASTAMKRYHDAAIANLKRAISTAARAGG